MHAQEFLQAELENAERHLARVRRIAARVQADLAASGLDEVAAYEKLAAHKAYRQLQRDEVTYQQVWLRVHRHLARLAPAAPQAAIPIAQARPAAAKPEPFRKPPTPGRNGPCSCGCCGNPLRQVA